MNEQKNKYKFPWILIIGSIVIMLAIVFAVIETNKTPQTPREQVIEILEDGVDFSNSLYDESENQTLQKEFDDQLAKYKKIESVTAEQLTELGIKIAGVRDFQTAIRVFNIIDQLNPDDLFYLLEKGRAYLELQQWEQARLVFEPMKQTWPVYEAYLGLIESYKHLDVPNYIIDELYEESIFRHRARFEVLEEYAKWLEETGRADKSIKYYELMNEKEPQEILQKKIDQLKALYSDA